MSALFRGVRDVVFPVRGRVRGVSYRYLSLLVVLPVLGGVGWWLLDERTPLTLHDPGVVAGSFGVLGGLLFAHAIFVFQLRVSYDAADVEPAGPDDAQRDLRVRPLIDEMFNGVLYASLIALTLTLFTALLAATLQPDGAVASVPAALIVTLALHLGGGVAHVISATTTAYGALKQQSR